MRLAIGTAQFGLDYGISNASGKVSEAEVRSILINSKTLGIDTLDTAIAYGSSETCLGAVGLSGWKVVNKLPNIPVDCENLNEWIDKQLSQSFKRLKVESIYGLLLHRPEQLLNPRYSELWNILLKYKERKLIKKIGFSIYSPKEISPLWDLYKPDIIQAPFNIFDRSLDKSGWLLKLYENGVEIHARSIFLQGLLLMKSNQRPKKFDKWNSLFKQWDNWLIANNMTALEASVRFALSEHKISKIIVGMESFMQFEQIFSVAMNNRIVFPENLFSQDELLINPARWSEL